MNSQIPSYRLIANKTQGLDVYLDGQIVMSSRLQYRWFSKSVLRLFDSLDNLILETKAPSLFNISYELTFFDKQLEGDIEKVESKFLFDKMVLYGNEELKISNPFFPFIKSESLFHMEKKIGKFKLKSLIKDAEYEFHINDMEFAFSHYAIIFFLIIYREPVGDI